MISNYSFKTLLPIGLLVFILVLVAIFWYGQKSAVAPETQTEQEDQIRDEPILDKEPTARESPGSIGSLTMEQATSCRYWEDKTFSKFNNPITGSDAAGSLAVSGKLRVISENVADYGGKTKPVNFIYMVVEPAGTDPHKTFYEHYLGLIAQGNAVNKKDGDKLLFRLGIIENNKFKTTAEVTDEVAAAIAAAAKNEDEVSLNVTIPLYPGSDAPLHFTYAC